MINHPGPSGHPSCSSLDGRGLGFHLSVVSQFEKSCRRAIGPPGQEGQEGWMRPEEYREATLAEQTGWWVHHHQQNSVELGPPPASLRGGFAISLEVARSAQSLACNIFQTETLPIAGSQNPKPVVSLGVFCPPGMVMRHSRNDNLSRLTRRTEWIRSSSIADVADVPGDVASPFSTSDLKEIRAAVRRPPARWPLSAG